MRMGVLASLRFCNGHGPYCVCCAEPIMGPARAPIVAVVPSVIPAEVCVAAAVAPQTFNYGRTVSPYRS